MFIYSRSSTKPANFVKIGSVDVEIVSLTEITQIFYFKFPLPRSRLSQINRLRHPTIGKECQVFVLQFLYECKCCHTAVCNVCCDDNKPDYHIRGIKCKLCGSSLML